MRKINAAETEFAKVCLKKDGHVNMHTREHVVTIHSRPVGMTSQAGISPLPDRV